MNFNNRKKVTKADRLIFWDTISNLDTGDLTALLQDLLEPAELDLITFRLIIGLNRLHTKETIRVISNNLDCSPTTTYKVCNKIKFGFGGYELAYKKLKELKKL